MSEKSLAETIILQCIEDLFNGKYRKESIRFFEGKGFGLFADIAGLGLDERKKILEISRSAAAREVGPAYSYHRIAVGEAM